MTYIENNRYFEEKDGKIVPRYDENGIYYLDDAENKIYMQNSAVNENGVAVLKVVKNGKETEERIIYITDVSVGIYKFTAKSNVGSLICKGPTLHNDFETAVNYVKEWSNTYGVNTSFVDPNANSWVSTLFTVLSIVVVCVVFFLIIRSTMGGNGKIMSFAKTKARVSTNIKVRFNDVAGAEEEKG